MKKYCTCCGKQVVDAIVSINEPYMTILKNSVCDFNGLICGYCSNDLDENARQQLLEILKQLPQSMLIISHDQTFLNQITNQSILLKEGKLLSI